jgi:hypothetical protein
MIPLTQALLRKFLLAAGDKLKGEWLLVGGTLLPAVGIEIRPTTDIDLVGLGAAERAQNLELMELADSLGLSIETINQAAAVFVKRANISKNDIIVLHQGKSAKIYRPSAELFWKLKVSRLTAADAEDCIEYLNFCTANGDTVDKKSIRSIVAKELRTKPTSAKIKRLNHLMKL